MVCGGLARRKAGESDRGEREGEKNERVSVCVRESARQRDRKVERFSSRSVDEWIKGGIVMDDG